MEEDNARERQLIKEMRTERYIKVASKARQRRERIPKVDMDQNPFCADRQLADEYQLQNLNRNPRYYMSKTSTSPRQSVNYHNYSSLDRVNEVKSIYSKGNRRVGKSRKKGSVSSRSKPQFQDAPLPTDMIKSFSLPSFTKVNSRDLTEKYPVKADHYSKTTLKTACFGHRPQSASRHLDPLTGTFKRDPKRALKAKTGMSAVQLQKMLYAKQRESSGKSVAATMINESEYRAACDETHHDELKRLEDGFKVSFRSKPPARAHRVLLEPDPDTSVADILHKYRRLSAGTLNQ